MAGMIEQSIILRLPLKILIRITYRRWLVRALQCMAG